MKEKNRLIKEAAKTASRVFSTGNLSLYAKNKTTVFSEDTERERTMTSIYLYYEGGSESFIKLRNIKYDGNKISCSLYFFNEHAPVRRLERSISPEEPLSNGIYLLIIDAANTHYDLSSRLFSTVINTFYTHCNGGSENG